MGYFVNLVRSLCLCTLSTIFRKRLYLISTWYVPGMKGLWSNEPKSTALTYLINQTPWIVGTCRNTAPYSTDSPPRVWELIGVVLVVTKRQNTPKITFFIVGIWGHGAKTLCIAYFLYRWLKRFQGTSTDGGSCLIGQISAKRFLPQVLEVRAKPCTVPTDARFPAPKSRYKWGYFGPPNWYNNIVFSSWSLYKVAKTNIYVVWSRKRYGSCFYRCGRLASVLGLLVGPLYAVFNLANRGFETGLFWSLWTFRAFAILT